MGINFIMVFFLQGPSEFLSTFNEIPAQTENLTIDSDSDIEELEEDSTIVLSEGEEMEITYKVSRINVFDRNSIV